ncbi:DUF445 domain-containing protein [Tamlana sp. I1]|uniref:DUF445 domain-containing protein n=1 Tax=Tamlana sp. I1 TaxID=2762061 RepID=UPI00188EBFF4|nr:DUF445 domain-containing protein [Tamlana sp. I1]
METKKNYVGRTSLLISIIGLIVVQALIQLGYLESKYWHILLTGFEAATIGGFADWFAVRALFHEIPIPIIRKHTNIIVRNRNNLTEGIVDLVTNKWLSPEIINEKLTDVQIVKNIVTSLKEPENTQKVVGFLKQISTRLTENIDSPEVVNVLQALLEKQVKGMDLATPLGGWLKTAIERGDHNTLWDMVLGSAQKTIHDEATRKQLLKLIENQMQEYKDEGFWKKIIVKFASEVGGVDNESIVDKIINSMTSFIQEAKNDPNHTVRLKFDKSIQDFAEGLIRGDEASRKIVTDLQAKLVDNADAKVLIQDILHNFKISITNELKENDTPFTNFIKSNVDKLLNELETDTALQEKTDRWIKETIQQLITKYHHEIGDMVRMSLSKLNDVELVSQIEEKVGNDLQYIRLNGAVVGGFVGILISVIRILFL